MNIGFGISEVVSCHLLALNRTDAGSMALRASKGGITVWHFHKWPTCVLNSAARDYFALVARAILLVILCWQLYIFTHMLVFIYYSKKNGFNEGVQVCCVLWLYRWRTPMFTASPVKAKRFKAEQIYQIFWGEHLTIYQLIDNKYTTEVNAIIYRLSPWRNLQATSYPCSWV